MKSGEGFTDVPLYHSNLNPAVFPSASADTLPEFADEQTISVFVVVTTGNVTVLGTAIDSIVKQPDNFSVTTTVYVCAFRFVTISLTPICGEVKMSLPWYHAKVNALAG